MTPDHALCARYRSPAHAPLPSFIARGAGVEWCRTCSDGEPWTPESVVAFTSTLPDAVLDQVGLERVWALLSPDEIVPGSPFDPLRHTRDAWTSAIRLWSDPAIVTCAEDAWDRYGSDSIGAQYGALGDIHDLATVWFDRHGMQWPAVPVGDPWAIRLGCPTPGECSFG